MILTTTDNIETHQILRYLGIVTGKAFVYAKRFKEMGASKQPELITRAEQQATKDAVAQADELGANAIVGVSVDFEAVSGPYFYFTFTGTAVKCQRK
ncbi:MAG: heavy metal-binding domain-containing protein [Bacteroidota bacterium]